MNQGLTIPAECIVEAAAQVGTPFYVYDETEILARCQEILSMPHAFGFQPRYAMKANSGRAILQLITSAGINIDASSLNEARRAVACGVAPERIMLTTQEVPLGADREELEGLLSAGMHYNVCSIRQLALILPFAKEHDMPLSIRIHPGVGSGESASRNTGDNYSCFGVHLTNLEQALSMAKEAGVIFDAVHVHIGSGGDPEAWRENIDRELGFVMKWFPDVTKVSFGGGFKVGRMPGEKSADCMALGEYAASRIRDFYERTGRKLIVEVEPGTYLMANSGFLVTSVIDRKRTGEEGFDFIVTDGGMEVNTRPLLYGSRHPFYVLSHDGNVLSDEFTDFDTGKQECIVVGRCCESGDSQSLNEDGTIAPRMMVKPLVGDFVVIGGAGAYCSSMSPFNYNSHVQCPEMMYRSDSSLQLIRRRQTLAQICQNELGL